MRCLRETGLDLQTVCAQCLALCHLFLDNPIKFLQRFDRFVGRLQRSLDLLRLEIPPLHLVDDRVQLLPSLFLSHLLRHLVEPDAFVDSQERRQGLDRAG